MTVLDAPRASWHQQVGKTVLQTTRLEGAMRSLHPIHVPHFPHISAHSALVSAQDKLSAHSIEITMTLAILFGVLVLLSFWAAVAR